MIKISLAGLIGLHALIACANLYAQGDVAADEPPVTVDVPPTIANPSRDAEIDALKETIDKLQADVDRLSTRETCGRECTHSMLDEHREANKPTPLAGYHRGHFFLRSEDNMFRISPRFRLQTDALFFAPEFDQPDQPKHSIFVRRARLEMNAGLFKEFVQIHLSGELTGRARFVDAFVRVNLHPWFRFQIGQFSAPVTLENQISDLWVNFMERSAVVRNLGYASKVPGAMIFGGNTNFTYQLGIFNHDLASVPRNQNNAFDIAGRLTLSPLANSGTIAEKLRIGLSGTVTDRDGVSSPHFGGAHGPGSWFRTSGGYSWVDLTYPTNFGADVGVVPTDRSFRIGGEFDLPIESLLFRAEFIYLRSDTNESSNIPDVSRIGTFEAQGAYLTVGYWIQGARDSGVPIPRGGGLPGRGTIPLKLKSPNSSAEKLRVQLVLRGEWLNLDFAPGTLDSDPLSPVIPTLRQGDAFTWFATTLGVNVWWTRHFRVTGNYTFNYVTDSELVTQPSANQDTLHELGARLAVQF